MAGCLVISIAGHDIGRLHEGDPPASFSDHSSGVRQVYVFSCRGERSVIERSIGGSDLEAGGGREVHSRGLEEIATLTPGEGHSMSIQTDRLAAPVTVTFRHVEADQPEVRPPTIKQLGDPRGGEATWTLLPSGGANACQQCGRDHAPEEPHDGLSLHYHYAFYAEHNRWPNWGDAMAHCTPEVQEAWRAGLRKHGIPEEQLHSPEG